MKIAVIGAGDMGKWLGKYSKGLGEVAIANWRPAKARRVAAELKVAAMPITDADTATPLRAKNARSLSSARPTRRCTVSSLNAIATPTSRQVRSWKKRMTRRSCSAMRRTIGSRSSNLVAWQIGRTPGRNAPFS